MVALFALDIDRVEGMGAIVWKGWARLSTTKRRNAQFTNHTGQKTALERSESV